MTVGVQRGSPELASSTFVDDVSQRLRKTSFDGGDRSQTPCTEACSGISNKGRRGRGEMFFIIIRIYIKEKSDRLSCQRTAQTTGRIGLKFNIQIAIMTSVSAKKEFFKMQSLMASRKVDIDYVKYLTLGKTKLQRIAMFFMKKFLKIKKYLK